MALVWLAMLSFYYRSASGMQMNAVNLRQQEVSRERSFCELHANTSAAAREICAFLLDPHAASQLEAYRQLGIDAQAAIDFQENRMMQSELAKNDHAQNVSANDKLLEKLLKFQQFRVRQRSKATSSSRSTERAPSSVLHTKEERFRVGDAPAVRMSSVLPFLAIAACVLIMFLAFWGLGSKLYHTRHLQKEGYIGLDGIRRHHGIAKHAERKVSNEFSSSEYYLDKCGKAFAAIVAAFFVIRSFLRSHNNEVLQTSLASFATCGREWCLVALLVLIVAYSLGVVGTRSLVDGKLEMVEKTRVRKKCKTCGSCSCYIRH